MQNKKEFLRNKNRKKPTENNKGSIAIQISYIRKEKRKIRMTNFQ